MASVDGYVYAVHANSGDVMWRFSTGTAISYSPRPIGDSVYVVTDEGGLFKIDAETGLEQWWTPRVREFLAASDDRVYCTDRIGRLLIIDAKSGGRLGILATEQLDLFIPNHLTDRVYLGTKTGLLQCLRGLNLERPIVYAGPGSEAQETIQVKVGAPADPATPMPAASDDPFGTGAGGTTPAADPFGTGTGGTAPAADPFGTTP
jgi:outer membrane protein assembly factor BamB